MATVASNIDDGEPNQVELKPRPWYRRGGMYITMPGMGINIFGPAIVMAGFLKDDPVFMGYNLRQIWYAIMVSSWISSYLGGMRTLYCVLVVPTYFSAVLLNWWAMPEVTTVSPTLIFLGAVALTTVKVGLNMSVCLHRYASHAAFQCGPLTRMFLAVVGCLANQGGPIWWSSIHRAHHKFCDEPGDPHSPKQSGVERAYSFFALNLGVVEEFVPRHLDGAEYLRVLDTWAFLVVTAELVLSYKIGGPVAMALAYMSGWMCQSVVLWFNVVNHPLHGDDEAVKRGMPKECLASDCKPFSLPPGWDMAGGYLPFHVFNAGYFLLVGVVHEGEHGHHHTHSRLAQRGPYDPFYWGFVYPLEKLGLVWNVHHWPKEKKDC